jgi:hypothetical protein
VDFLLNPLTKHADGETLYRHEQDIVKMFEGIIKLEYVNMYMLREADSYKYDGRNELMVNDRESAERSYKTIEKMIKEKYPEAKVRVDYMPIVETFSFG